jgi:hypothetical protein
MSKTAQLGVSLLLLVSVIGCGAGPRYITRSTGSKGQVKFLYQDGKGGQGIVKCKVGDGGDLYECRPVEIILEKD